MRLVIVSRAENVSGKEIMTLELGEGLRAAGHAVSFVTSIWNDGDYQARLQELGFSSSCLPLGAISATLRWDCLGRTAGQLLRLPRLWADYRQLLDSQRPERVLHTSWHHLLLLWPFLKADRDWFWAHEVLPDKPQYRVVFGFLAKRLQGFVAVSEAVRAALLQLGVPPEKVCVVHNGLKDIAESCMPATAPGPAVCLGIVGQVEEWKGHHLLLEALGRIARQVPRVEIHVYGSGSASYMKLLKRQAAELGLGDWVVWHGFVQDRRQIYQALDICVVPVPAGANEALPTVAIEAGFFGLPVVASSRGGLPEIIEDGVTGFLVEAGNVGQLADKLEELIRKPELRRSLGKAARRRAAERFGRSRFIADFESLMAEPPLRDSEGKL